MEATNRMTYRVVASNGTESRVVTFTSLIGGVAFTLFHDRQSADIAAAFAASWNPGWTFEVMDG